MDELRLGSIIGLAFNTSAADGSPIAHAGGTFTVVKHSTGATDANGVAVAEVATGLYRGTVDTADGDIAAGFYAENESYSVTFAAGTVDGVSVVGKIVKSFTVTNRPLEATSIAAAVWSYLKATAAALADTTFGRYIYDKLTSISAKTDLIGSATIEIVGPVATDGESITLFVGGSYLAATVNALEWSLASPNLTGYTINFGLGPPRGPYLLQKAGTVVDAGLSTQKLRVELTAAETLTLAGQENNALNFTIIGVSGSTRLPLVSGSCLVRRNYSA